MLGPEEHLSVIHESEEDRSHVVSADLKMQNIVEARKPTIKQENSGDVNMQVSEAESSEQFSKQKDNFVGEQAQQNALTEGDLIADKVMHQA